MQRPVRKVVSIRLEAQNKAKTLALERKAKKAQRIKRPLTGYQLFMKDVRLKISEDHPNASFGEINRLIGQMWNECTRSEKAKYLKMAEDAKKIFEESVFAAKTAEKGATAANSAE